MKFSLPALAVGVALMVACQSEAPVQEPCPEVQTVMVYQAPVVDTSNLGPTEALFYEGDTFYVMKTYFMAFLKKGPVRDQDSTTAMQLQMAHLSHLDSLYQAGKVCQVGPFGANDTDMQGIAIYTTETREEAQMLANMDPAVKAGRLVIDIIPWWAAKGSVLD